MENYFSVVIHIFHFTFILYSLKKTKKKLLSVYSLHFFSASWSPFLLLFHLVGLLALHFCLFLVAASQETLVLVVMLIDGVDVFGIGKEE